MLKLLITGICISSQSIMLSCLFSDHLEVLFYLPVSRCLTSLKKYWAVIFRLFFTFFLIGIKNITKTEEYPQFLLPFYKQNTLKAKMVSLSAWKLQVSHHIISKSKVYSTFKCTLYTPIQILDVGSTFPFNIFFLLNKF